MSDTSDRRRSRRGPLAAAFRFATSVPGQILVNTPAFTLPEELRVQRDWRVLDVGCGRAGVVRVVADRANLEHAPVAVDPSAELLALARQDMAEQGGPPVRLGMGASTALPFADDTFDLLLSGHTFRHLDAGGLRACLVEARRVLVPGGLFLAWEFAPTTSGLLDSWNRWLLAREGRHSRLRGFRELRALAYDCGFDWVDHAYLRPFLLPPIPRVSLIMGKAPPGWEGQKIKGRRVLQYTPEQA